MGLGRLSRMWWLVSEVRVAVGVYVGVYVDLCLLGYGVPLTLMEGFLFSRVVCCLGVSRSPMLVRVLGREGCDVCWGDVFGCVLGFVNEWKVGGL